MSTLAHQLLELQVCPLWLTISWNYIYFHSRSTSPGITNMSLWIIILWDYKYIHHGSPSHWITSVSPLANHLLELRMYLCWLNIWNYKYVHSGQHLLGLQICPNCSAIPGIINVSTRVLVSLYCKCIHSGLPSPVITKMSTLTQFLLGLEICLL